MKRIVVILLIFLSMSLAEDTALEDFKKANNLLFTPALYKEVSKNTQGNLLISPFSAEIALAFAQSGCKDETAEEIRNALRLPNDNNQIETAFKTMIPTLTEDEEYTFHIANKMYVKENFDIKEEFKKTATETYHGGLENIDFTKKTEAAKTINEWVEKHTGNKIHNLIDPENLNNCTRAILINALHLKAKWRKPFSNSKKTTFYKTPKESVEVNAMEEFFRSIKYFECHHLNAHFVEIPLEHHAGSLTIILPNEKEGIHSLESQIERVFVPHDLTDQAVKVVLPKFKIESEINMKKILEDMGVHKAFKGDEADLSGIAGKKGDLGIDQVKQKTFIQLNENGIEAAAATDVLIAMLGSVWFGETKQFVVDHPFIFYVQIKGITVFAGRVNNPNF